MISFSKFLEQEGFVTLDQIQGMGSVIPPSQGNIGSADFLQNTYSSSKKKKKKKKDNSKSQIQFFSQDDQEENDND
jgi:hypothetical protein